MRERSRRRLAGLTVAALAVGTSMLLNTPTALAGGGCHAGTTESSGEVVTLIEACPDPTVLRVDPGTTVRFENKDPFVHNVVGVGFAWGHPDDLRQGDSFTQIFDAPGVYPYACWIHPGMVGAVVVGDGQAASMSSPTQTGFETAPSSSPLAADVAAEASGSGSGVVLGWTLGGIIGLALGIVTGVVIRRRGGADRPSA